MCYFYFRIFVKIYLVYNPRLRNSLPPRGQYPDQQDLDISWLDELDCTDSVAAPPSPSPPPGSPQRQIQAETQGRSLRVILEEGGTTDALPSPVLMREEGVDISCAE